MVKLLDCTLRDGGYYTDWDFSTTLVADYLNAMESLGVDYVEIGFRSLNSQGFKGGFAFSHDAFLNMLPIPNELQDKIGVMLNGSELLEHEKGMQFVLHQLFNKAEDSPVSLVRIACHINQFVACLPAASWLKQQGYCVGFNVMQVADCQEEQIEELCREASQYPLDVLYFADSMGSLTPDETTRIIRCFQKGWKGELGIHTHDNMGNALANSLRAMEEGVQWIDATVTGMGRGPGNLRTEYLAIELLSRSWKAGNVTALLEVIRNHFAPLQVKHAWGSNAYYYLAGKYGIHPSYIQEMLSDSRYNEEDILGVINHLKFKGGKRFDLSALETARHFFEGDSMGSWQPADKIAQRDVLILGAGPSVGQHKAAIESYIRSQQPYVIALNTQKNIDETLINIRAACHPMRLLADCAEHQQLPQPLATPFHMLTEDVKKALGTKNVLDFGLKVQPLEFVFGKASCTVPSLLVIAYALAIATSGKALSISLVGFDGYSAEDPRRKEVEEIFQIYQNHADSLPLLSLTPTLYEIPVASVYAFIK
ncbi:MAG: aldolase catalytic domain-containing protein [Thiomicrorhabdus chilensis]|uniref:aldolase catalytic domain-containing protein n=1 Tax=Thiomicrorhabdus chilensis TaxID=63656 RepID=UPI00299D490A|nr:aldolase catalytic domain-containing protein [Thiomicrorhabdus chilensis]MDX1347272.1 aldolase catalytic domain-containing protein [Thiomicrorhabdus chilensis]